MEDYRITSPDQDEDDYAFSSDSGMEEDEPWGLYRAIYPFEAVGEHELGLEEGDLVDLRGRGGGEGWVVGVKRVLGSDGRIISGSGNATGTDSGSGTQSGSAQESEREGLAPESYLERVDLKDLLRQRSLAPTSSESATSSGNTSTDDMRRKGSGSGSGEVGGAGPGETIVEEEEAKTPTVKMSRSLMMDQIVPKKGKQAVDIHEEAESEETKAEAETESKAQKLRDGREE